MALAATLPMLLLPGCRANSDEEPPVQAHDLLDAGSDAHLVFDLGPGCTEKRIKIIYTAPKALQLGELTRIEAQVFDPPNAGRFEIIWFLENDETHAASGRLFAASDCKPDSHSCVDFACTGAGTTARDQGGAQGLGLYVVARYRDETCFDTARVALTCVPPVSL